MIDNRNDEILGMAGDNYMDLELEKESFMLTETQIREAYKVYRTELDALTVVQNNLALAKRVLERKRNKLLADGKIDGSNQKARDAQLEQLTVKEIENVEMLELDLVIHKHKTELARLQVRENQDLLSLATVLRYLHTGP